MKKKTRATASRAGKRPKSAASGRKAAPRRSSGPGIPAAGGVQRHQGDDSPAEGATGPDPGADRGTSGLRRYRLPAGHSEPARLRARAQSRDRLHQALSRRRRAGRARRRSPEADQRRLRTRRGRPGAEGHRHDAAARRCALPTWSAGSAATSSRCCCGISARPTRRAKAAALEEAIDRLTFVFDGRTITAGASAGVAILDTHSEAGRALEEADSAMYVRKALRRHEASS